MANKTGRKFGGREKGTPNKITSDLRQRINDFLTDNWSSLQTDFDSLDSKEKLFFYEKLLQYGLPKLQSTELTSNLEKLSDHQLNTIINELKKNIQ
jgi:hypothetical protein